MRFAIRFETLTSRILLDFICLLSIITLNAGPIRTAISFPFSIILALSFTLPISSSQASALPFGFLKVIVYDVVPEKFFTSSPPNKVHELSFVISLEAGKTGPPSRKFTFQFPASSTGAESGSKKLYDFPEISLLYAESIRDSPATSLA